MSIDRGMDKEDVYICMYVCVYIHTHTRTTHTTMDNSAVKKNEIIPFSAAWMDIEINILSEVSQTEKDEYHVISLICRI